MNSHEDNVKILEDAIHGSLGDTVRKCDELLKVATPQTQDAYVKSMLQPPTKAEKMRYSGEEPDETTSASPTLF